ncbi:MAG: FtsK/SpoIIIE domain-containing protein [Limisphaerales bacterium]
MSRFSTVQSMLDVAQRARDTIASTAERETEIWSDYEHRKGKLDAQLATALRELKEDSDGALKRATEQYENLKLHQAERFQMRNARIDKAQENSEKGMSQRIQDAADKEQYKVQKAMLVATKKRDTDTDGTHKERREFEKWIKEENVRIEETATRAKRLYRRYPGFLPRLENVEPEEIESPDKKSDEYELKEIVEDIRQQTHDGMDLYQARGVAKMFRVIPLFFFLLVITAIAGAVGYHFYEQKMGENHFYATGGAYIFSIILFCVLNQVARNRTWEAVEGTAIALATTREYQKKADEYSAKRCEIDLIRIQAEFDDVEKEQDDFMAGVKHSASGLREEDHEGSEGRAQRLHQEWTAQYERLVQSRDQQHEDFIAAIHDEVERETRRENEGFARKFQFLDAELAENWDALVAEWNGVWQELQQTITEAREATDPFFPAWSPEYLANWTPPRSFALGASFGELAIDIAAMTEAQPQHEDLALPVEQNFSLPLNLCLPDTGSLLIETNNAVPDEVHTTMNNVILRLLATAPPGRLSFTIIDPIGLGQNFAGVMHLADYEESLINSRIWTESAQIEARLKDLNEHMEKVIQMYLRNEYETITEYNEKAGKIAEKYHFVVVAGFPTGFTEVAARRLQSIASSGARCGVFTLIHHDKRKQLPQDFEADDLQQNSVRVSFGNEIVLDGRYIAGANPQLATPPSADEFIEFVHHLGRASKDSNRIEVPFEEVVPSDDQIWTTETTKELAVPVGRTGATKLQYLAIGRDTRQHALVAGKTGSGKSTLFHVAITNLALWSSPEEVEFYLIDFKKGVEFKCYAQHALPHAKVIAIESDREFGLSVLQRVDEELKRRGDMFRKLGVQDVAGFKAAAPDEPMPRSLLLIDEFQELFTEDDRVSQNAALLLDRIVRQGRAFGIHVILGSQTLGGAHTLPRPTMGQMVIRIALACNEADSYIILDDTNPAARHLTRPGEGIYNDSAGTIEGNSPFQVVWLSDEIRDAYLQKVSDHAAALGREYERPIVFEGNAPADVCENRELATKIEASVESAPSSVGIYLGAPNSIKGPTQASFAQQSGNNLMIVGQRDESTLSIVSLALVSLCAQFPAETLRIVLVDGSAPDSVQRNYLDRVIESLPHEIERPMAGDLGNVFTDLHQDFQKRMDGNAEKPRRTFIIVYGMQMFKKLRYEEDFGFSTDDDSSSVEPGTALNSIISEGAGYGMHVIASIDTLNNVNRAISRKAQGEFEMKILFQMSANDSATLIDSPAAGNLGLHRAIYYNEQEGHSETFRPYALPEAHWVDQLKDRLA